MKHLAPACFRAFVCAGGACPDSCCRAGWEIVPDPETLELYRKLPGEAGKRVREGILSGEEPLLRQDEARVCVLLDPDGLCHVQRHFGHGALCRVCREYPRFHREFGGLTEHGISLSCPTAYALATSGPLTWEEWEDEALPIPNDLDPAAYLRLRRGRELALALLGREELPLSRRLELVRRLAETMQGAKERIVRHDYSIRVRRWGTITASKLKGPSSAPACALGHLPLKGKALRLARRFLELEILSPAWREALERFAGRVEDGAGQWPPLREAAGEGYARWLAYSLYKYWMDALDDGDLLGRVDRSLDMLLLGMAMDAALPEEGPFLRRISREIEHCEENLEALLRR